MEEVSYAAVKGTWTPPGNPVQTQPTHALGRDPANATTRRFQFQPPYNQQAQAQNQTHTQPPNPTYQQRHTQDYGQADGGADRYPQDYGQANGGANLYPNLIPAADNDAVGDGDEATREYTNLTNVGDGGAPIDLSPPDHVRGYDQFRDPNGM